MARRPLPQEQSCPICRICEFPCFPDCVFRLSPTNQIYYFPDGRSRSLRDIFDNILRHVDVRETELEQERRRLNNIARLRQSQVIPFPEDDESVNRPAGEEGNDAGDEVQSLVGNLVPLPNDDAANSNPNLGPAEDANAADPTAAALAGASGVGASTPAFVPAENQENARRRGVRRRRSE